MPEKAVVLLSGGLDSTTLLYMLRDRGLHVHALSVLYGQRHRRELEFAKALTDQLNVMHTICDLDAPLRPVFAGARSALVGQQVEVPHGHYADETMKVTVVPNRNMFLLSTATALAVSAKAQWVAYAAHAGDHPIYPDCRPDFIEAVSLAIVRGTGGTVRLLTPFTFWTKAEIVKEGASLGVPFHLTYSCYEGLPVHCGRCSTCVERREAFDVARVPDLTIYEDPSDFWRTVTKR
jgi:7-cyano-7-deazaguanine synthase